MSLAPATLPAPLQRHLNHLGLNDLAKGGVPRKQINIRFAKLEVVANENGYLLKADRAGMVTLEPVGKAPKMRVITTSDHSAQFGRRAWR